MSDTKQIAALLRGEPPQQQTAEPETADPVAEGAPEAERDEGPPTDTAPVHSEQHEQAPEQAERKPITSFNDLAEAAGVDVKDLYGLQLNMGDHGEPITLGDAKDFINAGRDVVQREQALSERRRKVENDTLRANKALGVIMERGQITREGLEAAQQHFDSIKAREQAELMVAMPELQDAETRKQKSGELVSFLAPYGISAEQIDNIADASYYKVLFDALDWKQQIDEANADVKRVRKSGKTRVSRKRTQPSAGTARQTMVDNAKASKSEQVKRRAIATLLKR